MTAKLKPTVCEECELEKESVHLRACGYHEDVNNTEVLEIVCDECERKHLDDI